MIGRQFYDEYNQREYNGHRCPRDNGHRNFVIRKKTERHAAVVMQSQVHEAGDQGNGGRIDVGEVILRPRLGAEVDEEREKKRQRADE